MKRHFLMLIVPVAVFLSSCGGGNNESNSEEQNKPKNENLKGMIQIDLSDKGLPLLITVPDTMENPIEITVQDWGETEVRSGKAFQIKIAEGGDLALKKSDLADDLLFTKLNYIIEEENGIVYSQGKADDENFEPRNHFYLVINIKGIDYEIQDVIEDYNYDEKHVIKMYEAAKAIEASEKVVQ